MKRFDILKNEEINYISKVITSFLNEETKSKLLEDFLNENIEIKKAPEGSSCSNCYWNDWKDYDNACHAPFHYIGMQFHDCFQYQPKEN